MGSASPPCGRCGGPHRFDVSVPSVVWNGTIRSKGLSEYLCLNCIVREFVRDGRSFTATLWGDDLSGVPIEVRINEHPAQDAAEISTENTRLRARIKDLEGLLRGCWVCRWQAGLKGIALARKE